MDNEKLKEKIGSWLNEDENTNAIWDISDVGDGSVKITVSLKKTILDVNGITSLSELLIVGSSVTADSEESIRNAVVTLNEELILKILSD